MSKKPPRTFGPTPLANVREFTDADLFSRVDDGPVLDDLFHRVPFEHLQAAFLHSEDAAARKVFMMITDPSHSKKGVARICMECGLSLRRAIDLLREYSMNMALAGALSRLPQAVEDVADESLSKIEECFDCGGRGEVEDMEEVVKCPSCRGEGKVRIQGDKDSRKMLFEMTGITGKKGPQTAVQVNVGLGSFEDTMRAVEGVED